MNNQPANTYTSPVLTSAETAVYLRLCTSQDDPDTIGKAVRCVHRLVREAKLRPIKPGREYAFMRSEIDRYIATETQAYKPSKSGASVSESNAKPS